MEFHEKLRELRKRKGLTQEQLAVELYVSRTAVSKWESGRGYPGIDSLKAIANYFSVSLDDLLSGEEVPAPARADTHKFRNLLFGLSDCSIAAFLFLPFFGQRNGGAVEAVSLLSLTGKASYIKASYLVIVLGISLCGVLTLAFQNESLSLWTGNRDKVSLCLSLAATLIFIISPQPYAATFALTLLSVKAMTLLKWV